jgi:hypothetical protein
MKMMLSSVKLSIPNITTVKSTILLIYSCTPPNIETKNRTENHTLHSQNLKKIIKVEFLPM